MRAFDLERFEGEGFAMMPSLLSATDVAELIVLIVRDLKAEPMRGGVRDVIDAVPALRAGSEHRAVRAVVDAVLGRDAFVVRSTLFDKTAETNWKIPWHQDLTIAVQARIDTEGYWPWSMKNGVQHVQPPTRVLERMVTVRIHLDPCPASNGALRVIPGRHRLGRVNQNRVEDYLDESLAVTCAASAGEALVMRPLLFHASSASEMPGHRRVLHFDFAVGELENGLRWRLRT